MPVTIAEPKSQSHAPTDIGTLIGHDSSLRGGRPVIAGTGVTVRRIVGWYQLGLTPDEIAAEIPHLGLAEVHADLAYYHANRSESDADLQSETQPLESASAAPVTERP